MSHVTLSGSALLGECDARVCRADVRPLPILKAFKPDGGSAVSANSPAAPEIVDGLRNVRFRPLNSAVQELWQ